MVSNRLEFLSPAFGKGREELALENEELKTQLALAKKQERTAMWAEFLSGFFVGAVAGAFILAVLFSTLRGVK